MNKFKTITALLLTGILTLSLLTACGNSTSSDHADSSTAGPSQIVSSAQGGQQSSPEETSDGLVVTTAGKVQGTLNDGVYTSPPKGRCSVCRDRRSLERITTARI